MQVSLRAPGCTRQAFQDPGLESHQPFSTGLSPPAALFSPSSLLPALILMSLSGHDICFLSSQKRESDWPSVGHLSTRNSIIYVYTIGPFNTNKVSGTHPCGWEKGPSLPKGRLVDPSVYTTLH
jgi:hypothetical protein